jgi:hypothetical protein
MPTNKPDTLNRIVRALRLEYGIEATAFALRVSVCFIQIHSAPNAPKVSRGLEKILCHALGLPLVNRADNRTETDIIDQARQQFLILLNRRARHIIERKLTYV